MMGDDAGNDPKKQRDRSNGAQMLQGDSPLAKGVPREIDRGELHEK
jgi:hypothetical protein